MFPHITISGLSFGVPHNPIRSDRLGYRNDGILSRGDIHDYHGSDNALVAAVCSSRIEVTWRGGISARARYLIVYQARSWRGVFVTVVSHCRDIIQVQIEYLYI